MIKVDLNSEYIQRLKEAALWKKKPIPRLNTDLRIVHLINRNSSEIWTAQSLFWELSKDSDIRLDRFEFYLNRLLEWGVIRELTPAAGYWFTEEFGNSLDEENSKEDVALIKERALTATADRVIKFNPTNPMLPALRSAALAHAPSTAWEWNLIVANLLYRDQDSKWTRRSIDLRINPYLPGKMFATDLTPLRSIMDELVNIGVIEVAGIDKHAPVDFISDDELLLYKVTKDFIHFVESKEPQPPLIEIALKVKGKDVSIQDLRTFSNHAQWLLEQYPAIDQITLGSAILNPIEVKDILQELAVRGI